MSRAMNMEEFNQMMKFVAQYNSPMISRSGRQIPRIKYVDPVFDMRDNKCFTITFRGGGGDDKTFSTTNEESTLPYSLFQRVMSYLKGAPMGLMVWGIEEARRQARQKSFVDRVSIQIRQIWVDSFVVCPEAWEVQDGRLFEIWRDGKPLPK